MKKEMFIVVMHGKEAQPLKFSQKCLQKIEGNAKTNLRVFYSLKKVLF